MDIDLLVRSDRFGNLLNIIMENKSSPKIYNRCSLFLNRGRDSNSSTNQHCAASGKNGGTKRKASPDKRTSNKRTRVSDYEAQNTSWMDVFAKILDRKERSSGPPERRNSSVEDVSERSGKRKAAADEEGPSRKRQRSLDLQQIKQELLVEARRADFEAKYQEENRLGEGGCGAVFGGYRKTDNLPVAIKHIPKDNIFCKHEDQNGTQIVMEVAIMLKLQTGTDGSVGTSAPVSLLDWYDLDQELILVMERPVPCKDLLEYIEANGGSLQEDQAKIIMKQLVDAAKELEDKNIFHRDIKLENILIETGSDVPCVRLIDFGLGCFTEEGSSYSIFYGTSAYIPPEWYSRCTYRPGPSTVWQLGAVLFESLHRDKVFETKEFLRHRLSIDRNLTKNCQRFLRACLAKAPEERSTLEQLQLHPWLK